ncbi:MAG: chromate transporter [Clostridiales bacterium]|jgi:chromate transporter|nr:chromate transporter [Clostridiales bacterium]
MIFITLIYEFFKTGLFAIGGGYATIPYLQAMAEKYPWFTNETLMDMIAISESTPGPIGINMATYAGWAAAGIPGGIAATLALITPSALITFFAAKALAKFSENRHVAAALYGMRPAVTALIIWACADFAFATVIRNPLFTETQRLMDLFNGETTVKLKGLAVFAAAFFILRKWERLHPAGIIAAAAVAGIVLKL